MTTARLLGRGTAATGAIEEITLGTNLSFSGTTLNATGGGSPGGSSGTLQYNNAGAFGGVSSSSVSGANVTLGGSITATYLQGQKVNNTPVLQTGATSTDAAIWWQTGNQFAFFKGDGSNYVPIYAQDVFASSRVAIIGGNKWGTFNGGWGAVNSAESLYVQTTVGKLCISGTTSINTDTYLDWDTVGRLKVTNGTTGLRDLKLRSLISSGGVITLSSYTAATLPTGVSAHSMAAVTDSTSPPTYRAVVIGGGSTKCSVYTPNGTNWEYH